MRSPRPDRGDVIMKKIIFIGRSECGKTTLTQALKGKEITYHKTQYVNNFDVIIDTPGEYAENNNPCKYLFYNDMFLGIFDSTLKGTEREEYLAHAITPFSYVNGGKFDYLYQTLGELCLFLSIKSTIGLKLRQAYKNKDKKTLKILIKCFLKIY